jgi:hypothetical protein
MNRNVIRLGNGDPSGGEEILLVNSVDGWLLIIPWGYDYGCGITKVIKITEDEVRGLIEKYPKNHYIDTNKILDEFHGRKDESE